MKKNITIILLAILTIFFLINSFISKQENIKLEEFLDNDLKEIAKMPAEINREYYRNFKLLKVSNNIEHTLDSIWEYSLFLENYEKNLQKYSVKE